MRPAAGQFDSESQTRQTVVEEVHALFCEVAAGMFNNHDKNGKMPAAYGVQLGSSVLGLQPQHFR